MTLLSVPAWLRYGVVAVVAALVVWVVQSWRYEAQKARMEQGWAEERAGLADVARRAEAKAREIEQRMQEAVENVRTESRVRETKIAQDAASARAERDRLREQLATASRHPGTENTGTGSDLDGAANNAAVLRFVVGECVDRYIEVAGEADQLRVRLIGLQGYVRAIYSPAKLDD